MLKYLKIFANKKFKILEKVLKEVVKKTLNDINFEEILEKIYVILKKDDRNDVQIKELCEHMEHNNLTEKMITCQICDMVFKSKNQIKKHNKKEHKAGEG